MECKKYIHNYNNNYNLKYAKAKKDINLYTL